MSDLIHRFAWTSSTETKEEDALQLITAYSNSHEDSSISSIKDGDGWTLLHHACYLGWFEVAKVLIHHHQVDADCKNNFNCTPLHWAAFGGHCEIVRYLVNVLHCKPDSENKRGNTPLQIACWRGNLEVIKFLVNECKCNPLKANNDGLTPFYEALVCNHIHIVSFLLSTGLADAYISQLKIPKLLSDWYRKLFCNIIDFRKTNPLKPTMKVFVLGDIGVGKTTLVSAIEKYLCNSKIRSLGGRYMRVPKVVPHTAGINPVHIHSEKSGPMILFDFAGHQEFYSSHAALLENLESSNGTVLLIVVDLTKKDSELVTSLQSWMSFLDSIYSTRPPTIVIGSHSDILKKTGDRKPSDKLHSVCEASSYLEWDVNCVLIDMNCTKQSSNSLNNLHNKLQEHFRSYQMTFSVDTQSHIVNALIRENFKRCNACQVCEVIELLSHQSEGLFEYALLPSLADEDRLSEIFSQLSNLGEFVYLKGDNFQDGWIVFNKHLLLTEVNGTIFIPDKFSLHYNISNSTGIVPKHKLQNVFKTYNVEMISNFLMYFKYCYKIPDTDSQEDLYFFPQLVKQAKPSLNYFDESSYTCIWQLKCKKNYHCFTSRFTQSIIVQLATSFCLTPEGGEDSPVLSKVCNVWNLGIHWKDMNGVEIIVEFSESFKCVLLKMGCRIKSELHLIKLRSQIIRMILGIKKNYAKDIETAESFVYPTKLGVGFEFSKSLMYKAVTERKEFVVSKKDENIEQRRLNDILYMEPLSIIPYEIVKQICHMSNCGCGVDFNLFEKLTDILRDDRTGFKELVLKSEMNWGQLRELLFGYSIFDDEVDEQGLHVTSQGACYSEFDYLNEPETTLGDTMNRKLSMEKLKLLQGRNGKELKIIDVVAADWELIAIQIGFDTDEINILERNHAHDARKACWTIFNDWVCQNGQSLLPPTWSSLYDILLRVGRDNAAELMKSILS